MVRFSYIDEVKINAKMNRLILPKKIAACCHEKGINVKINEDKSDNIS